jgi:hypothetical protein
VLAKVFSYVIGSHMSWYVCYCSHIMKPRVGTSSDFAQNICYQSQWRGLITAQRVCVGSITDCGTLKGTRHMRSMT